MPLRFQTSRAVPDAIDAVVMGVYSDDLTARTAPEPLDTVYLSAQGFTGSLGETRALPAPAGGKTLVVVGLGRRAEMGSGSYHRVGAALAQAAARHRRVATTVLADRPEHLDVAEAARALAEGVVLGGYRFTTYKTEPAPYALERVVVVDDGGRSTTAALGLGQAVADAVCIARDLVNEPGGTLTPSVFAERAVNYGKDYGFAVRVRDERAIKRARLGGLLGVNRGSFEPPRFVELSWAPPAGRPQATVALVGKGITFDSGGLSLKSTAGMKAMKGDMAGAAAVLATFCALEATRPPVKVLGYLPLTDNMPGNDATRIGDVLHIRNGTTVEVLNTDAEGRLVLADALVMASEARPSAIVDLATLTAACVVALGDRIAGLMSTDDALADGLIAAAESAGEALWRLPLPQHLRPKLDSEIADLKNVAGDRDAGAVIAGLFLREFVGTGIPWAHLDIAGPAEAGEHDGEVRKGATGFGVRTLVRLLEAFPPALATVS
jgi:leucyl aminopeptidase